MARTPRPAPPTPSPSGAPQAFATRAFPPIQNPVYPYNRTAAFRGGGPTHVLERQPRQPAGGVDPRLTSQGSRPPVSGLTPIVPLAYQTPDNVWALYPA